MYANETQPLPVPDTTLVDSVRMLSAAAIYIHLNNRAQSDGFSLQFSLPASLQLHYEFLMGLGLGLSEMNVEESLQHDYIVPIACNTFSSNQELFQWPLTGLCRAIGAHSELEATVSMPGPTSDLKAQAPVEPLSLDLLDSLTVHTKMSLIHSIVTYINKQVSLVCVGHKQHHHLYLFRSQVTSRATAALSPGLVETYARLLVYTEIESLWVKGFLHQLMPQVFKNSMWGVLHTLLEIISYRLHHIHANFRLSLLSNLQVTFVGGSHPILSKHAQLNLTIESATLRLITGLGNADISPPKSPQVAGAQQQAAKMTTVLYGDSEELNRAVVLTLARSIHINGLEQQSAQWIKEVLTNIMQKTPHSWPTHTLQNFPTILQEFFKVGFEISFWHSTDARIVLCQQDNPGPKENKSQLKLKLDEEHKLWTSQITDLEKLQHFSTQSNSLFLCVLWKTLLETDQIHPLAYKVTLAR
jgi:mediator of RNA polymerase II transcription subunit 23